MMIHRASFAVVATSLLLFSGCGGGEDSGDGGGGCTPITCAEAGAECGAIDDGCGTSVECGSCGPDAHCSDGNLCEVEETCGPHNCPGCCDGTTCLIGDADSACGSGGEVCASCETGVSCNSGACGLPLGTACVETFEPCAEGLVCLWTGLDGGSGCFAECAASSDCGEGEGCYPGFDFDQYPTYERRWACTPEPAANETFFIHGARAEVPGTKPDGTTWDEQGGMPDLVLTVCAGATCANTTEQGDTLSVFWNESLGHYTEAQLRDATVRLIDVDVTSYDLVAEWQQDISSAWTDHSMNVQLTEGEVVVSFSVVGDSSLP